MHLCKTFYVNKEIILNYISLYLIVLHVQKMKFYVKSVKK